MSKISAEDLARVEAIRSALRDPNSTLKSEPGTRLATSSRSDPWAAPVPGPRDGGATELRSRALTAIERSGMPDVPATRLTALVEADASEDDETGERPSAIARHTIVLSQPAYRSAFGKFLRDPENARDDWTDDERTAVRRVRTFARAMSLGTPSAGGYLVPVDLDPAVNLTSTGVVNPMRRISRVETIAGRTASFITTAGVTASWDAEAAEVSDDSPTLANPSITAFTARVFVPFSFELAEDTPNIGRMLAPLFADAKDVLEATAFTTGSGTGEPKGLITALVAAGGSTVIATGTNTFAVGDLTTNQASLPPRWRANARWMASLPTINAYRVLPLFTNGPATVSDTDPPRSFGWQWVENNAMDSTLGAGADYMVVSGDFRQFIIVDRLGPTVEFVQNLLGANGRPTGQRGYLMHWRAGSDVLIADAFRLSNWST